MLSAFISTRMSYLANKDFISEIKCSATLLSSKVVIINIGTGNLEPKFNLFSSI